MSDIPVLEDGPAAAPLTVLLAHGAGAPMDSPFMAYVAAGLGERGFRVVRFEFPYMRRRRKEGTKRPPDPQSRLIATWHEMLDRHRDTPLVIGGKSMGGRMASLAALEREVRGLLVLGYPFHPPGKPEKTRVEHLRALRCPGLIIQGERDPFGKPGEVAGYRLPGTIELAWVPDGDHSWTPRKRSGRSEAENLGWGVELAAGWLSELVEST